MATIRAVATWFNARRRLVALGLFGWVVLIVVGAGDAPDADEWIALPDLSGVLMAVAALLAVIGLVLLIYLRPNLQPALGTRRTQSIRMLLLLAVVIVLLAIAFGPQETDADEALAEPEPASTVQQQQVGVADDRGGDASEIDIVAMLIIGVIAGAVLLRSRRRAAVAAAEIGDEHDEPIETDLGPAIDEATHLLRSGMDPRMAVLAAYAGFERALAERGQHREPAETPTEHMARVLATVPVLTAPAVRLGQLYELARFSDHPISGADRERAADELAQARRVLVALAGDVP